MLVITSLTHHTLILWRLPGNGVAANTQTPSLLKQIISSASDCDRDASSEVIFSSCFLVSLLGKELAGKISCSKYGPHQYPYSHAPFPPWKIKRPCLDTAT